MCWFSWPDSPWATGREPAVVFTLNGLCKQQRNSKLRKPNKLEWPVSMPSLCCIGRYHLPLPKLFTIYHPWKDSMELRQCLCQQDRQKCKRFVENCIPTLIPLNVMHSSYLYSIGVQSQGDFRVIYCKEDPLPFLINVTPVSVHINRLLHIPSGNMLSLCELPSLLFFLVYVTVLSTTLCRAKGMM